MTKTELYMAMFGAVCSLILLSALTQAIAPAGRHNTLITTADRNAWDVIADQENQEIP